MTRIGFDIGGILSKYTEVLALYRACLASLEMEVHIVTDMPKDKALAMLRFNGIDLDPAYVHACDYAQHGEECKAVKAKEIGLDILIDDFPGYVATLGAPALRLLAMPDPTRDYYHATWKTDGSEGNFGRRTKASTLPETLTREEAIGLLKSAPAAPNAFGEALSRMHKPAETREDRIDSMARAFDVAEMAVTDGTDDTTPGEPTEGEIEGWPSTRCAGPAGAHLRNCHACATCGAPMRPGSRLAYGPAIKEPRQ